MELLPSSIYLSSKITIWFVNNKVKDATGSKTKTNSHECCVVLVS